MTRVFVDTTALLTLLDRADPRHERARDCLVGLSDADLVTHGYVVAESLAVTRRRFGVDGAIALIDDVLPAINVLAVDPALHGAALSEYRGSLPSSISFVDQISLEIVSREGIELAFVLDDDFAVAGIRLIP